MAGREVKGFVVTPAMAVTLSVVLLTTFLGAIGWAYKSSTADSRETRDAVIRMETLLNERTRNFERQQDKAEAELKDERTLSQLHRENEDKKLRDIKSALEQKGIHVE